MIYWNKFHFPTYPILSSPAYLILVQPSGSFSDLSLILAMFVKIYTDDNKQLSISYHLLFIGSVTRKNHCRYCPAREKRPEGFYTEQSSDLRKVFKTLKVFSYNSYLFQQFLKGTFLVWTPWRWHQIFTILWRTLQLTKICRVCFHFN